MDEDDKNYNENIENQNDINKDSQSQRENLPDEANQTADNIKTGANLAKNAASGNYAGAAKDAIKMLGNKKNRKKIIIHGIISFLSPFIIILFLGAILLGVFDAVGSAIGDLVSGIVDFFTVDNSDGSIEIKDEDVDRIIDKIYEMGVNPADLKLLGDVSDASDVDSPEYQEALRKYVRKFYEAQQVTETLNYYHYKSTDTKTYGAIYLYRATSDNSESERQKLTYITQEKMEKYKEENDERALEHFSIDEQTGQLIVAGARRHIIETGSSEKNLQVRSETTTIYLVNIDYKDAVAPYTTKLEVLLYLTQISQNPEFVSAVTDLIKKSRIELTIMDNESQDVQTFKYSYIQNERKKHDVYNGYGVAYSYYTDSSKEETQIIRTTNIESIQSAYITYVKTWFSEQKIKYEKVTNSPIYGEPIEKQLPDEIEPGEEEAGSWKTNRFETTVKVITNSFYRESYREAVKLVVGERGDRDKYANGQISEPTFVGLMETEFKIPNSTRTAEPGTNLVSGAEMLFFLLQQDSKLENMEMIMRYALNQYTNTNDYGQNFNTLLDSLKINMLQVGTNYIVDITKSNSNIVITDAQVLNKAIETLYYGEAKENLINEIPSFLEMQEKYNVNAVFAIAVTIVESSGGTNWAAIAPYTHNWMSVTGSYNGQTYRNPNSSNPRTWRLYPSFREATLDFGDLIANGAYYFQDGKYTVDIIAPTYCNAYWGSKVSAEMTKIFNAAGIQILTSGT